MRTKPQWPRFVGVRPAASTLCALLLTAFTIHSTVANMPQGDQTKLVILGASYAASWGAPPLPGYGVLNRGVGGETTKAMHARFQRDVVGEKASVVLIWGHINNITQADIVGASAGRIEAVKVAARADYLAMLQQARAANVEVILATEIPMAEPAGLVNEARALVGHLLGKRSYADQVNTQVRDLNTFLRQLASREKLRLLDFEKILAPDGGARKPDYATEDHSHVTTAGYQALTRYAAAELAKPR